MTLGFGQEIYKKHLEHLVVPESKEVLKQKTYSDGGMSKGHRNQLKELQMAKAGTIWTKKKINQIVLDYNSKYKKIHEFILM